MIEPRILRVARVYQGWTIKRLAAELGYGPVWLSLCENGKRRPSRRLLKVWTQTLGLTAA